MFEILSSQNCQLIALGLKFIHRSLSVDDLARCSFYRFNNRRSLFAPGPEGAWFINLLWLLYQD